MANITPDDRVLKRGSLPFFWLGDTCWSAFTNMTDLETRKTLPAHCLYKAGVLHLEQAPCYRDALLIIEGESPC